MTAAAHLTQRNFVLLVLFLVMSMTTGCAPRPETNVVGYWIERQLGGPVFADPAQETASLSGQVLSAGEPVVRISVVVAERTGVPHAGVTDAGGRYRIEG